MKIPLFVKIIIAIVTCNAIGFLSGMATVDSINSWYLQLNKPSFNPPNWIFGPAWTLLYTLMGIAVALIWHKGWVNKVVRNAVYLFIAQLLLNAFWSIVFFGMQSPPLALLVILVLLLLIVSCIIIFRRIDKVASWLLIPYLLWVSFATALNFSIVMLN